jgi:hypothetical protein
MGERGDAYRMKGGQEMAVHPNGQTSTGMEKTAPMA